MLTTLKHVTIIGAITFVLLEIAVRAYFAITVGPDVLLFGTPYCCGATVQIRKERKPVGVPTEKAEISPTNLKSGYFKYMPFQKRRDFDENGRLFDVTINSHGFRGKEYQTKKEDGVIRIVTLGASSTFGHYDRDHHTYPFLLEEKLRRALIDYETCRNQLDFEVINFGVPHLTSDNIVNLYREEGQYLNPDIVTFYEGVNDTALKKQNFVWEARPGYYRAIFKLKQWFVVFALVHEFLGEGEAQFGVEQVGVYADGLPSQFVSNLEQIRDLVVMNDGLFLVITQQARSEYYRDDNVRKGVTYQQEVAEVQKMLETTGKIDLESLHLLTHAKIMDAVREWAESESVPLVDGIAALDQRRDLLVSWVHLKAEGNDVLAEAIAERVLELYCGFK